MSEKATKQPATDIWTVRNEKGNKFGPASLETLRSWAADGRIAPTSEVSQNGVDWRPVGELDLDMNWIVEMAPATFYGPIHRAALDELLRGGMLPTNVRCYRCHSARDDDELAHTQNELKTAVAACKLAEERVAKIEGDSSSLKRALQQAQTDLKARDHEFDAERQEMKAHINRVQAELLKKDDRVAALQTEVADLERAGATAQEAQSRLQVAEQQVAQLQQALAESKQAHEELRLSANRSELECQEMRNAVERERQANATTQRQLQAQREKLAQVRRSVQQLAGTLEAGMETEAEDAVIVSEPTVIPPVSQPTGRRAAASMDLASIEQQAQRELASLNGMGADKSILKAVKSRAGR